MDLYAFLKIDFSEWTHTLISNGIYAVVKINLLKFYICCVLNILCRSYLDSFKAIEKYITPRK